MRITELHLIKKEDLDSYKKNDILFKELNEFKITYPQYFSEKFTCNKWLLESIEKRMIFNMLYSDFLQYKEEKLSILDVGGGINIFQKIISQNHNYAVLDIVNHEKKKEAENFAKNFNFNLIISDWFDHLSENKENYDILIANDIFPNVDQRLLEFINLALKITQELRICLTYHQFLKIYKVIRKDCSEELTVKALNGRNVADILRISDLEVDENTLYSIEKNTESIFQNKRTVALLKIK